MKIKIITSFIIPAIVLLLFFFGLKNSNDYNTLNLAGNKIDNIELTGLENNNKIYIENLLSDKYTLINFWASWCMPCKIEHKFLLSLKKDKNLKILGINFKDKKKNSIIFLEELGNPYYFLAEDKSGKVSVKLGIYGIPESILVDKNFTIIKKFIGPINSSDYNDIIKIIKN